MKSRMTFAAVVALALMVGAAVGAWYELRERPPVFCELSGRPIHANMDTVVQVDGKRLHTCCPRCPLTYAAQTGERVRLLQVTDYVSGKKLAAADAYYVDGSQVEMCAAPRLRTDESQTPYARLFDRCSPSLLAFAREDQARAFLAQYGGTLQRLDELMRNPSGAPAQGAH